MIRASFWLPVEPFSVNNTYYRDRRHKTQEFRDWELSFISALSAKSVQAQLKKIRDAFKADEHAFVVKLAVHFPQKVLFNKAGQISSRAQDLSNVEKPILDLLFLPKIHVQSSPYGCPNINCDDKYVLRLTSSKKASRDDKYWIHVQIAIIKQKKD